MIKKNSSEATAGFLDRLTIRLKLLILSGFLLLALLATNAYSSLITYSVYDVVLETQKNITEMKAKGDEVKASLDKQDAVDNKVSITRNAVYQFNMLRYWITDLSASWLNESETSAGESKKQLFETLKKMAEFAPEEAKKIEPLANSFSDISLKAVDAFVDGNRVKANALLSDARKASLEIEAILNSVLKKQEAEASEANDKATAATQSSTDYAVKINASMEASIASSILN